MTFKGLKKQLPGCISDMFSIRHCAKINNDREVTFNKPNTDFMKKSFSYRAASAWNNLPSDVVNEYESLSFEKFKNLMNNHFEGLETRQNGH